MYTNLFTNPINQFSPYSNAYLNPVPYSIINWLPQGLLFNQFNQFDWYPNTQLFNTKTYDTNYELKKEYKDKIEQYKADPTRTVELAKYEKKLDKLKEQTKATNIIFSPLSAYVPPNNISNKYAYRSFLNDNYYSPYGSSYNFPNSGLYQPTDYIGNDPHLINNIVTAVWKKMRHFVNNDHNNIVKYFKYNVKEDTFVSWTNDNDEKYEDRKKAFIIWKILTETNIYNYVKRYFKKHELPWISFHQKKDDVYWHVYKEIINDIKWFINDK